MDTLSTMNKKITYVHSLSPHILVLYRNYTQRYVQFGASILEFEIDSKIHKK